MGKYLLHKDYDKIVSKTLDKPESDFYKYYSNKVNKYVSDNSDMFDELISAIDRRIEWLRGFHPIDYTQEYWMVDDDGNKKQIPLRKLYEEFDDVSYLLTFAPGKERRFNKSFFDEQIRIVEVLSVQHKIKSIPQMFKFEPKVVIPQLSTNLSLMQRETLFDLLIKGKFIYETNKESFIWAFGKVGEVQPLQWKPIKWMEAKQGLRELLTPILGIISNQHIRFIESLFIDKDCKSYKMSKDKEPSARCREIETILKGLNIENIPTDRKQSKSTQ